MIKALRKRTRPDNLVNQVRAGGKSTARRLYLAAVTTAALLLVLQLIGPFVFLDADGLVTKDRTVLAPEFNARVMKVHVSPGDMVQAGQSLLTVSSSETLDRIADLTAKLGQIAAREAQLAGRARQTSTLIPVAADRRARAQASYRTLQGLAARQLTTSNRIAEAARELFDAEREYAQITAEGSTVEAELATTTAARAELSRAVADLRKAYNDGRFIAERTGQLGPKVVSPGTILKLGETALEIFSGESYVVAYLPTNRLYSVEPGDHVIVTDGTSRARGRVERIEAMADALPEEFQNVFSSRERLQVVRVELMSGAERLSLQTKIKVVGYVTPTNMVSFLRSGISLAATTLNRIAGLEGPDVDALDRTAVGSIARPAAPAFTLPPDEGPPDWRALSDPAPATSWRGLP
jgi:multidrug resistance efflux pump